MSTYRVYHGPGAAFDGVDGRTFAEITDGTSNTLLVVESNDAVPWTKPDDLPYDPEKPVVMP
ncbi:hypothetical protein, partial [Salmonella sp. SAL04284]|uniref:hypothetical protein n=1 Tax=Salmonella sp. SAL04284 TaxID=3159862 RepID=UPI003978C8F7